MCGIAGFLQHTRDQRAIIENMTDALRHRGPDEGGVWLDEAEGVALGHRRLSIIDLSPTGSQPMQSADGNAVLCFNGEIYNFGELRPGLERSGYPFRGHSDTEVLLAALVTWGANETLRRISGMFAFAFWDRRERRLLLARDRVGKKPLYYGWCGDAFLFASELKSLRRHPDFDATLDRGALGEYIRHGWIPDPLSIYTGIRKLPPGCLLTLGPGSAPGSATPRPYWHAATACRAAAEDPFRGSYAAAVDQLDELLQQAVATRLVADVELGALLSGGVDSTTVVAMMQQQADRPIKTFCIGFTEPRFNEAEHAAAIAAHLGTDHHELYVTPQQCLDVVERLPSVYDEPFADVSQVPTLLVSELARQQVKVVLSGDGGDELFAGYSRYFEALARWRRQHRLPLSLRRGLRGLAQGYAEASWGWFGHDGEDNRRMPGWQRFGSKLEKRSRGLAAGTPQQLLTDSQSNHADIASLVIGYRPAATVLSRPEDQVRGIDPLLQMRQLDYIGYLPGDILVKVDRASMSCGLEVRAPILDTATAGFAWSLPTGYLVDRRGGKRILRDVMNRHVPAQLTDRPKRGFSPPLEDWLRGPLRHWVDELLDPALMHEQGYFHPEGVKRIWQQHLSGWRNHSNLLWALLMFQSWLDANRDTC
jgi:asparagine synthase (glutamine-hydrolysing)